MVGSTDLDTQPAVNVPAGTDGISWADGRKRESPAVEFNVPRGPWRAK
jgi:hypothetical protein